MRNDRRLRGPVCGVLLAVLAWPLVGCQHQPRSSTVAFVAYRGDSPPQTYTVAFDTCVYRVDRDGDLHIAARAEDPGEAGPIIQWLHLHVFWRPRPGVTFADATTTTATVRYAVQAPGGTAAYTGTAFVYPRSGKGVLEARLERGRLRIDSLSGDVPEILGQTRIAGVLYAREDPAVATDLVLTLERLLAGERRP